MTTEEKLKGIIIEKYRNMQNFADATDIKYQTLVSIFNRGINNSSIKNIIKICQELGISADELANNRIVPIQQNVKTNMHEITDILSLARRSVNENEFMTIDGKIMTKEEIQTIVDGLEVTIEIIKKKRERKEE